VCAVPGLTLIHDIVDVKIDGRFGNQQSIGALLVAKPTLNEPQYLHFTISNICIANVFGKSRRHVRGSLAATGVDRSHPATRF
jgi:hypothetical protein